ncbi:MAG: outer membrane protein assembly factor BamD [Fidelibacterota bacterium]
MKKLIILFLLTGLWLGCSSSKPDLTSNFNARFEKGMEYLEKKKYLRAQEEFNYVAISGGHTELGDDALFYLGEAYFRNKEYILARAEYDRLVRRMSFSPFLEQARWRICQCYVNESPKYYHDQTSTEKALDKLQEFIEDFPTSEYREEAGKTMVELREKLGMKAYQTGILYIKLGAYDSAILAFEQVLQNYYDTDLVPQAHAGIIQSHCLVLNVAEAESYYAGVREIIKEAGLEDDVNSYLEKARKKLARKNRK